MSEEPPKDDLPKPGEAILPHQLPPEEGVSINEMPIQEGVQHGPYPPMNEEDEAKMAADVHKATGYQPKTAEDSQLLQEAHQFEHHNSAINEAERNERVDWDDAALLGYNVEKDMDNIENVFQGKADEEKSWEEYDEYMRQQQDSEIDDTEGVAEEVEREPSPEDHELALAVVERRLEEARTKLQQASRHADFTRGYRPTPPGPRPHPEDGGMDHQDWHVARLEYEQYDDDYEIDKADRELFDAEEALYDLRDLKNDVMDGNKATINNIADGERARLAEEERRAARAEERRDGKKFEGSKEFFESLIALQGNPELLRAVTEKTGPNGWQLASYRPTWGQGSVFRVNPEGGPLNSFGSYTQELEVVARDDKVTINYAEIPENGWVFWLNEDWRATKEDFYVLTVDSNGLVTNHFHRRGNASQQHLIGSRYTQIHHPIHNYEGVQEFDFEQADFDKLRGIVDSVKADVQQLSSSQQPAEQNAPAL